MQKEDAGPIAMNGGGMGRFPPGGGGLTCADDFDPERSPIARERQPATARELRRMFDEVKPEPTPDDFLGLSKIDEED